MPVPLERLGGRCFGVRAGGRVRLGAAVVRRDGVVPGGAGRRVDHRLRGRPAGAGGRCAGLWWSTAPGARE